MKREIIAWACCGSGGVFGFKSNDTGPRGMFGGVAKSFSSRNNQASATLPTPIALRARKRRRDQRPLVPLAINSFTLIKGLLIAWLKRAKKPIQNFEAIYECPSRLACRAIRVMGGAPRANGDLWPRANIAPR